ncbi:hypothetical protein QU666_05415 [Leptotrichia sp. HMT-225]|jgi:hypothetical protein|uniref:hypothetical protein n=3 Tax=unclassified Leptotrichia TaxID=2633022 RepID=UPI00272C4579|nr:hypothetical protein [Leptotrichia sp. HMT-225]WLD75308.1 hypothetical protein QU666_05415 [Leptotrichia sp. HMT-225]
MDRYFIEGKNKIINGGVVHKIHYSYEIEFEKKIKELYFKVLDYKTNSDDILVNKINLLFLAKELVFFLDNNDRIVSVKNYLEIQKKLLIELYMLEIRNPDYKDVLEYIEEKLEDERNFINYIMELDFMEFLFGGREKNKKIREFYGIDRKKNIEVDVLQEMKGNIEKIKYSINPASLNKILLQYRLNNEKIPEYYLDGSGEKIYENFKILKAFLKIKSGRKNDLEREIELVVKNLSRELEV